ncbi:hypothetical protein BJ165DRAFT_1071241 [Panaeolus papilionaceus]|nr:hypothetical protein BJ165DRAFT_1071241 [Panaeolus papilionaceus]
MSPLYSFPTEIKDSVLSIIARDGSTRRIATQVSSHFRDEIYRLIFCDVVLDGERTAGFLDLVSSSFSATGILPRIRNFVLKITPSWTDREWSALENLFPLLALNDNLRSFSFSCTACPVFGEPPSKCIQPQLTKFSSVRLLKLRGLAFHRSEDLENLLTCFPQVMHIELQSVACNWETKDSSHLQLPGEFSAQFNMEGAQKYHKIVHWKLSEPVFTLQANQIDALAHIANSTVSSSLQSLGLSLHHLSVGFHLYDFQTVSSNDILKTFDLSSTPKLRRLSLGSSRHVLSLMPWVPVILYTLSKSDSSTLTTLEIVYASSRQIHLDRTFLRCLSFALSEPAFKTLQTIHFIGYQNNPCDLSIQKIVQDQIKSVLRLWDEKKMLEFSFRKSICSCSIGNGTSPLNLDQRQQESMWLS